MRLKVGIELELDIEDMERAIEAWAASRIPSIHGYHIEANVRGYGATAFLVKDAEVPPQEGGE